jgi:ADP-L-glycero-D-manno-heptose 6-epimerase
MSNKKNLSLYNSYMNIILTGAFGFIGSHLTNYLKEHNLTLVSPKNSFSNWNYIKNCKFSDIWTPEELLNQPKNYINKNFDLILHIGGTSSQQASATECIKNNTKYSLNLIRKFNSCKTRIVYASSASCYGNTIDFREETLFQNKPNNPYAASKLLIDKSISELKNVFGLRYFNVYGKNEIHKENQKSPINNFLTKLKNDEPIKIYNDKLLDPTRDFIYIDDVCLLTSWIAGLTQYPFKHTKNKNPIYNVGTGKAESFFDVAKLCCNSLNLDLFSRISFEQLPKELSTHYQYFTKSDNTKIINAGATFYKPIELQTGISKIIQSF